jgi:hypothetical protein
VEIGGQVMGRRRGIGSFKRCYGVILLELGALAILLAGSPCFGQSTPSDQPTAEASASNGDLFSRVIANQKRLDANLNVYERVERVEIRKTASDPNPSEVKVWRDFPART